MTCRTWEKWSSACSSSLATAHSLPSVFFAVVRKGLPLAVALQAQLVVRDEVVLRVAEPRLHQPKHGGVDVLVVAGLATDVEHDRDRVHPLGEPLPRSTSSCRRGESSRFSSAVESGVPSGSTTPLSASPMSLAKLDLPEP